METPLLETPPDNAVHSFVPLGYIAAYDAPLNCDSAFLAYKETDKDSGNWRVRIRSTQTVGAVFEAPMIANKARETGVQGKPFFLWASPRDSWWSSMSRPGPRDFAPPMW